MAQWLEHWISASLGKHGIDSCPIVLNFGQVHSLWVAQVYHINEYRVIDWGEGVWV